MRDNVANYARCATGLANMLQVSRISRTCSNAEATVSRSNDLRGEYYQWLRKALEEASDPDGARWSHGRLAALSDVSRATIASILNRRGDAQEDNIEKLAEALGVPLPEIRVTSVPNQAPGQQPVPRASVEWRGPRNKSPLVGLENRYSMYLRQIAEWFVETSASVATDDVLDMLGTLHREARNEITNAKKNSSARIKAEQ